MIISTGGTESSSTIYNKELYFLHKVVATLLSPDDTELEIPGSYSETLPVTSAVKKLLDSIKQEGNFAYKIDDDNHEDNLWTSVLGNFEIPKRKDTDFTDRLWKVSGQLHDILFYICLP